VFTKQAGFHMNIKALDPRLILGDRCLPGDLAWVFAPVVAAERAPPARRLGMLSERYESGGRGPGTVSSGKGDPGGVSYGTWQLASRTGTVSAFLAAEGKPWLTEFGGAKPGSSTFGKAWKQIAARDGEEFAAAQHAFIARTHYRPAVAAVKARCGIDLDARHPAVRDATWSVAVQHGGASRILTAAVARADKQAKRDAPGYDRRLVEAIYAERGAYVSRLAERTALSSGERKSLRGIVARRYPAELAEALALFADDGVRRA
jgi:hypothetical protein